MVAGSLAIAWLTVTCLAIAVACVATRRARAARTALRASEAMHRDTVQLERNIEAVSRLAGDVAHDLNDLLTGIAGHSELLIASLDPSGTSIQDAREIRSSAL